MAIALATSTNAYFKVLDEGQCLRVIFNAVVTDSYPVGGEDLTTILTDSRIKVSAAGKIRYFTARAQSSNGNMWGFSQLSGGAAVKMLGWSAAGTVLSGGYAASKTDDIIRIDITFPKYGCRGDSL